MKYRIITAIYLLFLAGIVSSNTDVTGAIDSRVVLDNFKNYNYLLHGAEIDIKYTYADEQGDRVIAFLQIPYSTHWKSEMFLFHYGDAYLIVKGALERPNIKIGRFDIPFGLLKTFDSHFSVMPQLFEKSLQLKKDIGAELFGYYKMLMYDVSFTQGYNRFDNPRNDMPITLRLGLDNELIICGISYYNSTHSIDNMMKMKRIGIDFEKNINPFIVRGEAVIGNNQNGKGFLLMIDFPFFFGIEGAGTGLIWHENVDYQAYGLELKKEVSFLSIGIGYLRIKETTNEDQVVLQTIVRI